MIRKCLVIIFYVALIGQVAFGCGERNNSDTDSSTPSDTDTDTDTDSDSDSDTWPQLGVCGIQGSAVVLGDSFVGTEDHYLTGDNGHGKNICVVRFDVEYVGKGKNAAECPDCHWAHKVVFKNPDVVTDEGGVCENSDLGLDATAIAAIDGTQVSYGFAPDMSGHYQILHKYLEAKGAWSPLTHSASWDDVDGELSYKTTRWCGYR